MNRTMLFTRRFVPAFILTALALASVGCNSFEKRWEAAASTPTPANDISGRWHGTWKSDSCGHTGELWAIITKQDDGSYHTEYHATYGQTFKFEFGYELVFKPEIRDGRFYFGGEHDLGFPFGHYKYSGYATPTDFHADYSTQDDYGTYVMTRPSAEPVKK
jgi:hypothetical protein